jgi:trans-L-3-hydroxyproline dehydratase
LNRIRTADAHTEGEPLRVILEGFPQVEGSSVLEYRRFVQSHFDHLRTALMWEPRGHADMYGCLILPPVTDGADFSVVFLHNEGYSTMCGHGIIAVTRVAIDHGIVEGSEPICEVRIDTPAGRVNAYARVSGGRVSSVYFDNVPSFVETLDAQIEVGGIGTVRYDLAFGGAYYAYVDAEKLGLDLVPDAASKLIQSGRAIKRAIEAREEIEHPTEPDLGFLYGTIFVGRAHDSANHSRNVCIFAEGELDRSPTGTGVSGRLAIHHARQELVVGDSIRIESIIGSHFSCTVLDETTFAGRPAIIPRVEGRAYITGEHQFLIDPEDPLRNGFIIR